MTVLLAISFAFGDGQVLTGVGLIVWAILGRVLSPSGTRLPPAAATFIALAGCCAIVDKVIFPIVHTLLAIISIAFLLGAALIMIRPKLSGTV